MRQIVLDTETIIRGAELIIHNAPFDIGFMDHELRLLSAGHGRIADFCTVFDSLVFARQRHPGQKNSLDALCQRYSVDNSQRDLHGALLDAEILADVYLAMTGGQTALALAGEDGSSQAGEARGYAIRRLAATRPPLRVITASADELAAHERHLDALDKAIGGVCVWRQSRVEEEQVMH